MLEAGNRINWWMEMAATLRNSIYFVVVPLLALYFAAYLPPPYGYWFDVKVGCFLLLTAFVVLGPPAIGTYTTLAFAKLALWPSEKVLRRNPKVRRQATINMGVLGAISLAYWGVLIYWSVFFLDSGSFDLSALYEYYRLLPNA